MSFGKLPIIGYTNHFETGTVTTDGTNEDNAFDWLTTDYWTSPATATAFLRVDMGSAVEADYVGLVGHTLFSETGSVQVQYGPNGAAWTDALAPTTVTPTDDGCIFLPFTKVSAQWWQILFSGLDAAITVAVAALGPRMQLERGTQAGFTPPDLSRADKVRNSLTNGGQFAGRTIARTGITGSLDLKNVTDSRTRSVLDAFLIAQRTQGWFLSWDPDGHPDDVAYCWTKGTPQPQFAQAGLLNVKIDYNGRTDRE